MKRHRTRQSPPRSRSRQKLSPSRQVLVRSRKLQHLPRGAVEPGRWLLVKQFCNFPGPLRSPLERLQPPQSKEFSTGCRR